MGSFFATLLSLIGCGSNESPKTNPMPKTITSSHVSVGQVWQYKTRDNEAESRLTIGKIESLEKLGSIVHIKISGLKVKSPSSAGGIATHLSHTPITEAKLIESITLLTQEKADLAGFDEGYTLWLEAYRTGKGGVFTTTVREIVESVEFGMNQGRTK